MKQKDLKYINLIKSWLSEKSADTANYSGADLDSVVPSILRTSELGKRLLVVIAPVLTSSEQIYNNITAWEHSLAIDREVIHLPDTEAGGKYLPETEALWSKIFYRLLNNIPDIVIASATSLLAEAPPPNNMIRKSITIRCGDTVSLNELAAKLVELDYDDEFEVNIQAEFSKRGGLIDIFSPAYEYPARIEFFGDEIDTIRAFSPDTQRSVRPLNEYCIIPRAGNAEYDKSSDFFQYVEQYDPMLIIIFPEQCEEHIKRFADDKLIDRWNEIIEQKSVEKSIIRFLDFTESSDYSSTKNSFCYPATNHIFKSMPEEAEGTFLDLLQQALVQQIQQWQDTGYRVVLDSSTEGGREHLEQWLKNKQLDKGEIDIISLGIPAGLIFPDKRYVFLTERELFYSPHHKKTFTADELSSSGGIKEFEEASFADLDEGDYAVHLTHGLCRFNGIKEKKRKGQVQEVLELEFADDIIVSVPMWQGYLINRYIGSRKSMPTLSKIGGTRWSKAKAAAMTSIKDLASDMLRMQAIRDNADGTAFPGDDIMQKEFESLFPYPDTLDQKRAAEEIKHDMAQPKPMDRLLCGDVGFGKTEVAIRAAFKSVMSGRQVAILVPTTVLAQQHYYNFRDRFAEYPVIIEMLSRFRTTAEQRNVIKRVKERKIDILIGTHRIVQSDVEFPNLGLVIVDEEQRFGVEHKERLKKLRTSVDVLTMTATPIPRTLYMSMTGLRDLSTISTAPVRRLPVKTVVSKYDEKLIVSAIEHEVERGGQVFFIHNRVHSIEKCCQKLMEMLPDVKFEYGHGRMPETELEQVMARFLDGEIDVLVSTTIIESGLDIPNANTIIIERADRFGLAELYQLRGRVGRWTHQAYAYLMIPQADIISGDARKRLGAIRRYTHLGAGFKLALRDLEIRGAGNLLGAQQSGHINNIGFELYCQLLRATVAQLNSEPEVFVPEADINFDFIEFAYEVVGNRLAAAIHPSYVNSERLRVDLYRRLSQCNSVQEQEALKSEIIDRFGKLPEMTEHLFSVMKIRLLIAVSGFKSLSIKGNKILFERKKGIYLKIKGEIPKLENLNSKKKLQELLKIVETLCN